MIRNLYQLCNKLDRCLAWRKKELSTHKLMVQATGSPAQAVVLRAGILLLYAHWEGFVKEAAQLYLGFIAATPREFRRLKPALLAVALRPEIIACSQAKDPASHMPLVNAFRGLDGPPPITRIFGYRGIIRTRSNLKFDVFQSILQTLAIDDTPYLTRAGQVRRLVNLRNGIAHGRGLPADESEYQLLHTNVVAIVDQFRDDIEDGASRGGFFA